MTFADWWTLRAADLQGISKLWEGEVENVPADPARDRRNAELTAGLLLQSRRRDWV